MNNAAIDVHQAIHGYDEGHRLINSSMTIAQRDAKTMLILSDASGPSAVIPNEGYLTGYPLVDSGMYAIARTWAATEKKRPGCVWTHTLLIDFADLALVESMDFLLELFARPNDQNVGDFACILKAHYQPTPANLLKGADNILWALYFSPNQPIISISKDESEHLIMRIWSQQWPRLRRKFRFCSLAFADRSSKEAIFDLQFIPSESKSLRGRFKSCLDADSIVVNEHHWFEAARQDVALSGSTEFRQFLRDAGGDVSGGREMFIPLCVLFELVGRKKTTPGQIDQAIDIIEKTFEINSAHSLRQLLTVSAIKCNEHSELNLSALHYVSENLFLLVNDPSSLSFVKVFIDKLWYQDPKLFVGLLSEQGPISSIANEIFGQLPAKAILNGINNSDVGLVTAAIGRRPEIIAEIGFWQQIQFTQAGLDIFCSNPFIQPSASRAAIAANRTDVSEIICKHLGGANVLRLAEKEIDGSPQTRRPWIAEALKDKSGLIEFLLEETGVSASFLAEICHEISPDEMFEMTQDPLLFAMQHKQGKAKIAESQFLAAFSLRRALGSSRNAAIEGLLRIGLDEIYFAAMYSKLHDAAWELIEARLPDLGILFRWDRCQRIRAGIGELIVSRHLSPTEFLSVTKDDALFEELAKIVMRKGRSGKNLLRATLKILRESDTCLARQNAIEDVL